MALNLALIVILALSLSPMTNALGSLKLEVSTLNHRLSSSKDKQNVCTRFVHLFSAIYKTPINYHNIKLEDGLNLIRLAIGDLEQDNSNPELNYMKTLKSCLTSITPDTKFAQLEPYLEHTFSVDDCSSESIQIVALRSVNENLKEELEHVKAQYNIVYNNLYSVVRTAGELSFKYKKYIEQNVNLNNELKSKLDASDQFASSELNNVQQLEQRINSFN